MTEPARSACTVRGWGTSGLNRMPAVISASDASWKAPFTGLSPRTFSKLITMLRREGADVPRPGRPWSLPLEDRVLLVATYRAARGIKLRMLAEIMPVRSHHPS